MDAEQSYLFDPMQNQYGEPLFAETDFPLPIHPPSPIKDETTCFREPEEETPRKRSVKSKRKDQDKIKNRESAALCRQRRKQYIQKLEQRVQQQDHEISILRRKVEWFQEKEKLRCVAERSSDPLFAYEQSRAEIYERLEK